MTEPEQIAAAHKLLVKWVTIIGIIAVIACGWLIYIGEKQHGHAVKVPGGIEIYP